jgi:hypothetical protein
MRLKARIGKLGFTQHLRQHTYYLKSLSTYLTRWDLPSPQRTTWTNTRIPSEHHTWIPSKLPTKPPIPLPREPPNHPNQSHLIKKSRPLLSMSTTDISVLHSIEVAHFHHESCFPRHAWHYLGAQGQTTKPLQSPLQVYVTPTSKVSLPYIN